MKTNMVLWRDNIEPTFNVIRYADLIHQPECRNNSHYTSYFDTVDENSYAIVSNNMEGIMEQFDLMPYSIQLAAMKLQIQPFYDRICDNILQELNILTTEPYKVDLWCQGYLSNSSDGHKEHHHYHSKLNTVLSWVHFLEPVEEDCFQFITGEESITPQQRKNDFIVFPCWARHHVKPYESEKFQRRLVMAGNIVLSEDDNLEQ